MANKTAFLTGASGTMGWAGFLELYGREELNIVVLLRDSEKNRKLFAPYLGDPRVKIVWGDLTDYDSILECITGSDYVLHVGGLVSPVADHYPKKTIKTNVTAAEYIVKAIKAQPNPDAIKTVYIGTVAQTGDRNEPVHWGRTGDPIKISIYDHYAISKTMAEAIFAESGLKYWVSMRQTGIMYPGILSAKNMEPIMFHVVLRGVLEWATVEDSATLLANFCTTDLPDDFWGRFYNIGSGKEFRITNYEFEDLLLSGIGMGKDASKKLFEPNWFITQNFHGQWYTDSDVLDDYLHFRHYVPVTEYFGNISKSLPPYMKLSFLATNKLGKAFMKKIALDKRFGTLTGIENNDQERMSAFFGSKEKWSNLPTDWAMTDISRPSDVPTYLDHGYDESKPISELDLADMQKAAEFRGGACLAEKMKKGDIFTPIKWRCAFGHEFTMSPNLVLRGGHWCPECLPMP
ncbi:MAG: NAD(P)-dependent oxidoreductase, partial [Oscillospiraceae bacterium]